MQKIKLSEIFEKFKPRYILGTTYSLSLTFFESVVYPFINKDNLHQCLILCDELGFKQATSEFTAISKAGSDYLVSVVPSSFAFHSKLWLFVEESRIGLLIGSGNLTQSGFINSVELFDFVELSKDSVGNKTLSEDLIEFLDGLTKVWDENNQTSHFSIEVLNSIINEIKKLSLKFDNNSEEIRLVSNFKGNIGDKLPKAKELWISSPFFGKSAKGLSRVITACEAETINVYPAIHPDNKIDIDFEELKKTVTSVGKLDLEIKKGYPHLKVYAGKGGEFSWFYTTSANCTEAALFGKNIEVGLLRKNFFENDYFKSTELPDDISLSAEDFFDREKSSWAPLECDNTGLGIKISIGKIKKNWDSLIDVKIIIKSLTRRAEVNLDSIFDSSLSYFLNWDRVEDSQIKDSSCYIHLIGKTNSGELIEGAGIVNNLHLANLSPKERQAHRSIITFLTGEELPEFGDLSAIFGLLDTVEQKEFELGIKDKKESNEDHQVASRRALWPPQMIGVKELSLKSSEIGAFSLCQRALSSLITDTITSQKNSFKSVLDSEDDQKVAMKLYKKLMTLIEQSQFAFEKVISEYKLLEPNEKNVGLIWGKLSYITLVHILIIKKSLASVKETSAERIQEVLIGFIRSMFSWRLNESTNGISYQRYKGKVFVPLIDDLSKEFELSLDSELSKIIFTFFAHLFYLRRHKIITFPLIEFLRLKTELNWSPDEIDTELENVFNRYLYNSYDGITWLSLKSVIPELMELGWKDCVGLQELKEMIVKKPESNILYNKPGHLYCTANECKNKFITVPAFSPLMSSRPVQCESCNSIIAPIIFKDKIHDEA